MREFWIIYEKGYSTWVSDKPLNSADTTDEIHVIEAQALKDAEEKIKRLEKALEKCKEQRNEEYNPWTFTMGTEEEKTKNADKELREILEGK